VRARSQTLAPHRFERPHQPADAIGLVCVTDTQRSQSIAVRRSELAGPDTYATDPPFTAMYAAAAQIVGADHPIPLHETGVVPQPSTMFPSTAPWVLWNIWAGYQISENSEESIRTAYESPYTITRDEVPDLN